MSLLDDLSGAELEARLRQRGFTTDQIATLLRHRDTCFGCRKVLKEVIGDV